MSSDESDAGPQQKRKRKIRLLDDSSGSEMSSGSPILGSSLRTRRRVLKEKNPIHDSSDSDSDSGSSIHRHGNKRKKIGRVASDTDSESSGSDIITIKRTRRLASESDASDRGFEGSSSSQWETDLSDTEAKSGNAKSKPNTSAVPDNIDSDSSDGQSDKCPICLISFKLQEIGTPESCDHMFCLECIQEWSKNMNTCPVDRQEYNLILVRKNISGKVVKQVPVEKPVPQNDVDIVEDPTFCEVCGTSNNEDQMLLCDGCDLGFHLYCLTPPLQEVPAGAWFCNDCSPDDEYDSEIDLYEVELLLNEAEHMGRQRSHRWNSTRLIPRTRQSERVRRRIANNRQQQNSTNNSSYLEDHSSHSVAENSQHHDRVSSSTSRGKYSRKKKSRRKKAKKVQVRYKTVYVIDEVTGETVAVKKKQLRKGSKRKTKRASSNRSTIRPKSVKKRLATQLGICKPRTVPQNLPDVRQQNIDSSLGGLRYQAGIPTLHLFGQSNQLDYFSGEDEDDSMGGSQLLFRRAPNHSDVFALRRVARTKASLTFPATVSSSTDVLDSILHSQEQFHSRNSSYSLDPHGNFKVEKKGSRNNYIDLNRQYSSVRQRPNSYQNQYPHSNPNTGISTNNYQYHSHNLNQYHSTPSSTMTSTSSSNYMDNNDADQNSMPQDYTQRTLYASNEANIEEKKDEDEQNMGSNTTSSESDVDIYSDIETVSTSKADDNDLRPPSPPIISNTLNTGTDDDNNDSEPDMVIDDEKMDSEKNQQEYNKEETAVTSTVEPSSEFISNMAVVTPEPIHSSMEIQSGAIQSSNMTDNRQDDEAEDFTDGCPNASIYSKENIDGLKDTEDVDSDDGCPNFSIYSNESKKLALHTDISLSAEDNIQRQDAQVGEISSSPNFEIQDHYMPQSPLSSRRDDTLYNPENTREDTLYNPENIREDTLYNPENTTEDTLYNPENTLIDRIENNEDLPPALMPDYKEIEDKENTPNDDLPETIENQAENKSVKSLIKGGILGGLYSDSEDESVVKKDDSGFAINDINHMTEDISEEERSYTPCLDEKAQKQGLEGLDTEMISDEDRNDFDESHELKTVSDGDALEINAKESELDFTRPEDYEEGEIVDKNKAAKKNEESEQENTKTKKDEETDKDKKAKKKEKDKDKSGSDHDKSGNKENEGNNKQSSFKKLSKNNKERNYRDKDPERQHSPTKSKEVNNKKEKKREKRKELERYNVRAIIADKPRPQIIKDQFGRDIRRTPSKSRSKSYTPPPIQRSASREIVSSPSKTRRSLSRPRKSTSKERTRKSARSRHRSLSYSRSRSPQKKRSRSKNKKRKRSPSRYDKRRKSRDRYKSKKKTRPHSGHKSSSPSGQRRNRDWIRREWSPTLSMSPSPELRHMSPSWTPPRLMDNSQVLRHEIGMNHMLSSSSKKKKEKKRKGDKRTKETDLRQKKRRRERERTPPPSKEVFASGDNILVSVSFNNENETRDVTTRDRRKSDEANKKKKERRKNRVRRDLSGIKPIAIIDLERSPFREITSPKDIIVLTDSDNNDNEDDGRDVQKGICDSSQQVASPERTMNYSMGPKTPPEPQVKFSLNAKPPQIRAISNPLHEPDDMEHNDDVQEEISSRINEGLHKGPNTPPEPPNSPPSSPDAYDPFEPTKSRSPTPTPMQSMQSGLTALRMEEVIDNIDSRAAIELLEKSINPTPDGLKSLTPPIADVQPADSQSSIQVTPESQLGKSPERIGVVINQIVQPSLNGTSKPVAQTTPFSSVPTSIITSTPISSNLAPPRINILNSTIITPPHVASSIPQRIVLPNQVKSSPVKIPPTKAIKSTPIKPMPSKNIKSTKKSRNVDEFLDFDSPYSPGSSDYEDLFEPPVESITKPKSTNKNNAKSPQKHQSVFDALFGGSPSFNKSKNKNKFGKKSLTPSKTKTVGVKLDEDNLKILDELPNSAVEMQVKDKFLKKLNRQERVVEEVKLVLKPHYNKKRINKEEYKDILRRSVPKICHNKSGEINPTKIKNLIEAYVKKIRHSKKVTSSSSVNPQKV